MAEFYDAYGTPIAGVPQGQLPLPPIAPMDIDEIGAVPLPNEGISVPVILEDERALEAQLQAVQPPQPAAAPAIQLQAPAVAAPRRAWPTIPDLGAAGDAGADRGYDSLADLVAALKRRKEAAAPAPEEAELLDTLGELEGEQVGAGAVPKANIPFPSRSLGYEAYMTALNGSVTSQIPAAVAKKSVAGREPSDACRSDVPVGRNLHSGQIFLREFFVSQNPNKGILIWWDVGTGKTIGGLQIADQFVASGWTVLWVTLPKLKASFYQAALDDAGMAAVRTRYETDPRAKELIDEFKRLSAEAASDRRTDDEGGSDGGCTVGKFDEAAYLKVLTELGVSLGPFGPLKSHVITYAELDNLARKAAPSQARELGLDEDDPFRRVCIIMDEADKFWNGTEKIKRTFVVPDPSGIEGAIARSHRASGRDSVKIVQMTGTPFVNSPEKNVRMLNVMIGEPDLKLPTEPAALRRLMASDDWAGDVRRSLVGLISHFRGEGDPNVMAGVEARLVRVPISKDMLRQAVDCVTMAQGRVGKDFRRRKPKTVGYVPYVPAPPRAGIGAEEAAEIEAQTRALREDMAKLGTRLRTKDDKKGALVEDQPQVVQCLRGLETGEKIADMRRLLYGSDYFDPDALKAVLPRSFPKIAAVVRMLLDQDRADLEKRGGLFKHAIYSDEPAKSRGIQLLVSALVAYGFTVARLRRGERCWKIETPANPGLGTIVVLTYANLGPAYFVDGRNPTLPEREELADGVRDFWNSPENADSSKARIAIFDKDFREGISLYGTEYLHFVNPPLKRSDVTQPLGRTRRRCRSTGLPWMPGQGWRIGLFVYAVMLKSGVPLTRLQNLLIDAAGGRNVDDLMNRLLELSCTEVAVDGDINAAVDRNYNPSMEAMFAELGIKY